jgi:hypothetical protein
MNSNGVSPKFENCNDMNPKDPKGLIHYIAIIKLCTPGEMFFELICSRI